jgi:ParB family transcriptional regulator, chromosome partitioning protein
MGHARALLPLSESDQTRAAEEVVTQRLNVRQTERLVQRIQSPPAPPSTQSSPPVIDVPTQWRQRISLSHTRQGTDVRLQGLSDDELMALLAWLAMRDT